MDLIFMGTPAFACPALNRLLQSRHRVIAVVTQPDRPQGRGREVKPSPVKELALAAGLPVYQPVSVGAPDFVDTVAKLHPDVVIVVAFGQILPESLLRIPVLGCVNVHASLLPRYRGAAPIQRAVMDGQKVTGVTTMLMDKGLDTGDILLQQARPIAADETMGEVHDSLAVMGADLLLETLEGLENGTINREAQDSSLATYAPPLTREEERIDWTRTAAAIKNHVRGMNPYPGAYTSHDNKKLKIWRVKLVPGGAGQPGETLAVDKKEGFVVQAGEGAVLVQEVQPQGKGRMAAADFARGYRVSPGLIWDVPEKKP